MTSDIDHILPTLSTSPDQSASLAPPVYPVYPGIRPEHIYIIQTQTQADAAYEKMKNAQVLGFDTESRPVFLKGQNSDGPHLIQLATAEAAFLFPVVRAVNIDVVKALLESEQILKVGFGLSDDMKYLHRKLGIHVHYVLDLARALRENKQHDMGAKAAVAKFFGMELQKSKKTSTSNWASSPLTEKQMQYAANDAQVALLIYLHCQNEKIALKSLPFNHLPHKKS